MKFLLSICVLIITALFGCVPAEAQRVAVWNPEKGTLVGANRFALDLPKLDQAAQWLREAGMQVERLTAAQIVDPGSFSAQKFDALVLPGDAFPKSLVQPILNFGNEGGVLIGLQGRIPFNARIEATADGMWDLSPNNQGFAWQGNEILNGFGMRYIYEEARHDQGVNHIATPLLKRYLPAANDILSRKLPSMWIVPLASANAQFFPLLRSQRIDGADVPPQLFVSRAGKRTAIVSVSPIWTQNADPQLWPHAKATTVALARLAGDIKNGKADLGTPIVLPENLAPPEPLRSRVATGQVNPEGAKPLQRWGRFDGTSLEFGPWLGAGKSHNFAANDAISTWPRALEGGAMLNVALQPLPTNQKVFLRVRGAFAATGAGLQISIGGQSLWNELLTKPEAGGEGNFSGSMDPMPVEFTRCLFVPNNLRGRLEISNLGRHPIFFDALQLETRDQTPEYRIGAMWTDLAGPNSRLSPEITNKWSIVRCNARTQNVGAPGDPKRWEKLDALMATFQKTGAPIHLIFEGTPQWAAISAERYELGKKAGRPHTVPPDPQKYAQLAEDLVKRYGDKIEFYEFWNEIDIQQFWRGTMAEYIEFCRATIPVVRRLDPTAKIITAGLAGYKEGAVSELIRSGLLGESDWIAFHPYNGQSTGWDLPYGIMQGHLFSAGVDLPIYCDESGFVWKIGEWFTNSSWSPEVQLRATDAAFSRLLANGVTKFAHFHATGSEHHFDIYDSKGQPRPAAAVLADYAKLGQKGGRRMDVSLAPSDNVPLQGIGVAASLHQDGTATLIINAATSPLWQREIRVTLPSEFSKVKATNQDGPIAATIKEQELRLMAKGRVVVELNP